MYFNEGYCFIMLLNVTAGKKTIQTFIHLLIAEGDK